jgi:hypothetical protein
MTTLSSGWLLLPSIPSQVVSLPHSQQHFIEIPQNVTVVEHSTVILK